MYDDYDYKYRAIKDLLYGLRVVSALTIAFQIAQTALLIAILCK